MKHFVQTLIGVKTPLKQELNATWLSLFLEGIKKTHVLFDE